MPRVIAIIPKIDEFDGTKEDWPQYMEQLDHFFDANVITDAGKNKSTFLAVVGPATYTLLRNLVSADNPVSYLGRKIDQHGLHPLQEKVRAVKDARSPKNVSA